MEIAEIKNIVEDLAKKVDTVLTLGQAKKSTTRQNKIKTKYKAPTHIIPNPRDEDSSLMNVSSVLRSLF